MPAPISIVMPTLNAEHALERSLPTLIEGLSSGMIRELIIVDGGSDDHTETIAKEVGARFIVSTPSRGGQIAKGIEMAQSDLILILHADSQLEAGWSQKILVNFKKENAAYFKLQFNSAHFMAFVTSAWANIRSRLFGLPYGDQGLLIHRDLLSKVGGYPQIPLMEDVVMARQLRRNLHNIPITITTSADRYEANGWLRQGTRNLSYLCLFLLGTPPETLSKGYQPDA